VRLEVKSGGIYDLSLELHWNEEEPLHNGTEKHEAWATSFNLCALWCDSSVWASALLFLGSYLTCGNGNGAPW